jgi:hypothetical protein
MPLITACCAALLSIAGCGGEDGTEPDTTTDTSTDAIPDPTTDPTPDTSDDTGPGDVPTDGTGGPYGTLMATFTTSFIYDYTKATDRDYLMAHATAGVQMTPAFSGTYSTAGSIPGAGAIVSQSLAFRVPPGSTAPAMIAVIQQSFADMGGTAANPFVELDFRTDALEVASYDLGSPTDDTVDGTLLVTNSLSATSFCVLAVSFSGTIDVTSAVNTTAVEGGQLQLSGTGIEVYHPSDTPEGDITASFTSAGYSVCPIE